MFESLPEPAVSRRTLIIGAGIFWVIGAGVLLIRAAVMLENAPPLAIWILSAGIVIGLVKYYWILNPLVHKNVARIYELSPHKSKICIFAFQSLRSYLMVILMVFAGLLLRLTGLPLTVMIAVYSAIGAALLLGGITYFRVH